MSSNIFSDDPLNNPIIIDAPTNNSASGKENIYNLRMYRNQTTSRNAVFTNVDSSNNVNKLLSSVYPIAPNGTATTNFISIPKNNIIEASNNVDFKFNEAGDYLYNIQFDCFASGGGSVVLQLVDNNNTVYPNAIIVRTVNSNSTIVILSIIVKHAVNDICKLRFSGFLTSGGAITINMSNLNVFIEKI